MEVLKSQIVNNQGSRLMGASNVKDTARKTGFC